MSRNSASWRCVVDRHLRGLVELRRRQQDDRLVAAERTRLTDRAGDGRHRLMARCIDDGDEVIRTEREVHTLHRAANPRGQLLDGFGASGAALRHDALDSFGRVGGLDHVLRHGVLSLSWQALVEGPRGRLLRAIESQVLDEGHTDREPPDRTLPAANAEGADRRSSLRVRPRCSASRCQPRRGSQPSRSRPADPPRAGINPRRTCSSLSKAPSDRSWRRGRSRCAMTVPTRVPPARLLHRPVLFRLKREMFVGSYQRVFVRTRTLGLAFEDLDFEVPGGEGCTVSMSKDETFDAKRPTVMLLAGDVPGDYKLVATERSTGNFVGEAHFVVTNEWDDPTASPTRWFGGAIELSGPQPTWGGGDPNGPQNVPTTPQTGTRNIVVVLVDTNDQRWATTGTAVADAQQNWADNLVNGTIGSDGVTRSVAQYYREVSYFNGTDGIDISGNVLPDVVHLPNGWSSYFTLDVNSDWQAVSTFCRTVMTTAGVDRFAGANMIVCVVQPVSGPPSKIAWPYGGFDASGTYTDGSGHSQTVSARGVVMSNTWGDGTSLD